MHFTNIPTMTWRTTMTTTSTQPWSTEPDVETWTDSDTGLLCHMSRNTLGAWCGYVGVFEDHPAAQTPQDEYACGDFDVHGGLTFRRNSDPHRYPRKPDDRRTIAWFGFDCAHYGDLLPEYPDRPGNVYRDMAFVRAECARLAKQLQDFKPPKEDSHDSEPLRDVLDPSTWDV